MAFERTCNQQVYVSRLAIILGPQIDKRFRMAPLIFFLTMEGIFCKLK